MGYNVGDKVRVVHSPYDKTYVGEIAVITRVNNSTAMLMHGQIGGNDVDNEGNWHLCFELDEFEKVEEGPAQSPTLSSETIDHIAIDSLRHHYATEMEPLQKEAFRIVLRYYGVTV